MNNSLQIELKTHLQDVVLNNFSADSTDFSELHQVAFNESEYLIGYYRCEQWLKQHDISPFEAIADIIQWELDVLGESEMKPSDINSESVVNLLTYILGEQVLGELDLDLEDTTRKELLGHLGCCLV